MTFTVTLSASSSQPVTVNYATANGTATTATNDYQAASGTVTFTPGETSKPVIVNMVGDTRDEPDETLFVNLTNAVGAAIADAQGKGTILDNDPTPTLSINDTSTNEADGGSQNATFTLTLSAASDQTVSVQYATAGAPAIGATATTTADFASRSGTLNFAPGVTTKTITVPVKGDSIDEFDETYLVNLTGAVNATLADSQGVGTIVDNDAPPTISISDTSVVEADSGNRNIFFNVTLSAQSGKTVGWSFASADGSAKVSNNDYVAKSGAGTSFAPGATTKQVFIQTKGDTVCEPDEAFFVNLSGVTNATIADGQGVGIILNNDACP
jgi:hypothetical protein